MGQGASLGAVTQIDNHQFLQFYQQARKTIQRNIPEALRRAGLRPFQPEPQLAGHRPKTHPFVSLTDNQGRHVDIPVTEPLASRIDGIVEEFFQLSQSAEAEGI